MPNSSAKLCLGIDIGSSGLKGLLLDPEKGIVGTSSYPVDLYSEKPGFSEADTDQWWLGLKKIVSELVSKDNAAEIAAIAFSGMVPAVLFLDKDRKPLRRAILQNDARAVVEISEIAGKLKGVEILELTGSALTQQSVAPTVLWISKHEPEVLAKTSYLVGSYDWAAMTLGADPHVERNWAIESGLYDWNGKPLLEISQAVEISWPELLSPVDPGTLVGEVSQEKGNEIGLLAGTKIIVGGADHVLSAYGAGLINSGDALIKLGGAGDILVVTDEKVVDERLYLDAHPMPEKWLPNGCMATSGSLLRWEQKVFKELDLQELDRLAEVSAPGNLLVLPFLLGEKSPYHDPDLRGAIIGLHLGTTNGDIHRSFLEAIAYGFKQHAEIFSSVDVNMQKIRVTNGGSTSRLWRQILSDVLQKELHSITNHPGASFAAAVIAGIGSGAISNWSFVEGYLEAGEMIIPSAERKSVYQERFEEYLQLKIALDPISHSIARSQR
ncbi:MAG: FGGY-family carbohydrate kinase [Candidatus Planktophila sp.]